MLTRPLPLVQSYDARFGARPMRRWLEHNVVTELSRMIISGALPDNSLVAIEDAGPSAPQRLTYIVTPGEAPASPAATRNGPKRGRAAYDFTNAEGDEDEDMLDQ